MRSPATSASCSTHQIPGRRGHYSGPLPPWISRSRLWTLITPSRVFPLPPEGLPSPQVPPLLAPLARRRLLPSRPAPEPQPNRSNLSSRLLRRGRRVGGFFLGTCCSLFADFELGMWWARGHCCGKLCGRQDRTRCRPFYFSDLRLPLPCEKGFKGQQNQWVRSYKNIL